MGNPKSDLLLQVAVFGLTAAIISLLFVKLYPKNILNPPPPKPPPIDTILAAKPKENVNPPSKITIPSLSIALPIAPAQIQNNQWTLYEDKVSWLVTSKTPGNGNVILFAHNWDSLLGKLNKIKTGQEIIVEAAGQTHIYLVQEVIQINPADTDAIISSKNQLTIYTCEGSFDEKRLVVRAVPESS